MAEKKKKAYIVRCVVNMCAEHVETVVVKTTKPHLACQMAVAKLKDEGFFHASVVSCKEIE